MINVTKIVLNEEYFKNLKNLLEDKMFLDVCLVKDGECIKSNKFLLSSQSEFFKTAILFNERSNVKTVNRIILTHRDDIPIKDFQILHDYVLSGKLEVDSLKTPELINLYELSCYYRFDAVIKIIDEKIINTINLINCWDYFQLSYYFGNDLLSDICAQFISQNIENEDIKSLIIELEAKFFIFLLSRETFYVKETTVISLIEKWMQINKDADLKEIISLNDSGKTLIRYFTTQGIEKVKSLGIFSSFEFNKIDDKTLNYRAIKPLKCLTSLNKDFAYEDICGIGKNKEKISISGALAKGLPLTFTIKLDQMIRINSIRVKFVDSTETSYSIGLSIDKENWIKIIDYREYRCHSMQQLWFNDSLAKYIKIKGKNIFRPGITFTSLDTGSTLSFLNISRIELIFDLNKKKMTDGVKGKSFFIPDTNIAHYCKGAGARNNYSCRSNISLDDKYTRPYKYKLFEESDNESFILHLPQPVFLSSMKFLIWDKPSKDGNIRKYDYHVDVALEKNLWKTVTKNENQNGWQIITFEPQVVSYIRIEPTNIYNYGKRKIFAIVHFECPGSHDD